MSEPKQHLKDAIDATAELLSAAINDVKTRNEYLSVSAAPIIIQFMECANRTHNFIILSEAIDRATEAFLSMDFHAREDSPPVEPGVTLDTPINGDNFDLTVRASNTLRSEGVSTVGDIMKIGRKGLRHMPNIGDRSVDEIERKLLRHGFVLRS